MGTARRAAKARDHHHRPLMATMDHPHRRPTRRAKEEVRVARAARARVRDPPPPPLVMTTMSLPATMTTPLPSMMTILLQLTTTTLLPMMTTHLPSMMTTMFQAMMTTMEAARVPRDPRAAQLAMEMITTLVEMTTDMVMTKDMAT